MVITSTAALAAIGLGAAASALAVIGCRSFAKEAIPPAEAPDPGEERAARRERALGVFDKVSDLMPLDVETTEDLRRRLALAGMDSTTPAAWRGMQILIAVAFLAMAAAIALSVHGAGGVFLALLCAVAGFAAPELVLRNETKNRRERIEAQLANVLEELSIAVKSGYTLERAIKLVGEEMDGELAAEFARCDRQLNLTAATFAEAMRAMADRCGAPGVTSFTSSLIQAKEQGSSVSRVLEAQAKLARSERMAKQEETINKLPAKLVAPIFGIMMLIIVLSLVPPIYDTVQLFMGSYNTYGGVESFASSASSVSSAAGR